jgi:hypothetical protein
MLVFNTQMHIITFLFAIVETTMLFFYLVYYIARPNEKKSLLNICLLFLLVGYNITGGLYPDLNMPGSYNVQMIIAYFTGFITPSYFPYYVYKTFNLEKMKFHSFKGVAFFLILPYIIFSSIFIYSGDLTIDVV